MKLRNFFLGLLLCATAASAQDVITKTDGSRIDARVEEITEQVVKYRKASNPTGPVYSIPLTSIMTITYENGSVDSFNNPTAPATPAAPAQTNSPAESNRYSQMQDMAYTSEMNDAQLLKLNNTVNPEQLRKKAKTYKTVGWIGGATFLVAGILVAQLAWDDNSHGNTATERGVCIGAFTAVGAAWCLGFNLKANSLIRRANEIEMLSSNIIEDRILNIGNKPLIAGINVMNNQMTHTRGIGVSLKLNF